MTPQEVEVIRTYCQAGAHPRVLASLLQRDRRTVRAALKGSPLERRPPPPLPLKWQDGLPQETVEAIQEYRARWWTVYHQISGDQRRPEPVTREEQEALLTAMAATLESPLAVARWLGVDVNRILLALLEDPPNERGHARGSLLKHGGKKP